MDFGRLTLAVLAAVTVLAGIVFAAAVLLRRARSDWQAAAMPLAVSAGFLAGYAILFDFPRTFVPELWRTPVFVAVIAGGLSALAIAISRVCVAEPLRLLMILVCSVVVSCRVEHRWIFFVSLFGLETLTLWTLKPLARGPATASAVPLAFTLSAATAAFVVLLAVDQNLGRMLVILSTLMGAATLVGLLRFAAPVVHGSLGVPVIVFPTLCALAAYYNYPLPLKVFPLLAVGPFGAAVAYLPPLQTRTAWCLACVGTATVLLLTPAIILAMRNAPEF